MELVKKMVNKVGDRVIQIIPSGKKVKIKKIFRTLSTMLTEHIYKTLHAIISEKTYFEVYIEF